MRRPLNIILASAQQQVIEQQEELNAFAADTDSVNRAVKLLKELYQFHAKEGQKPVMKENIHYRYAVQIGELIGIDHKRAVADGVKFNS